MRTTIVSTALLSFLLISGFSCRETPTGNGTGTVYHLLTAEDVGVTDVFLRIRNFPGFQPSSIILKRSSALQLGDTTILKTILTSPETLIVDEGLLPKHTYNYTLTFPGGFGLQKKSAITVTTMDTTNSNFTWEIDTLGDGNSSVLYDAAIVSDTCVYVVGEIYKRDSTGQFNTQPYNFLHWNGQVWDMKSISNVPVRSLFVFSENDIWAGTSGPYHWNGTEWRTFKLNGAFNGYVNKFWGTSSSQLYMVGTNGAIAWFDGERWQKLESGTELDICDIWGSTNSKTGELEILAVASKLYSSFERKILKISGTTVSTLSDSGINWPLSSVWFVSNQHYYVVGSGIYEKRKLFEMRWKNNPLDITTYYTYSVRGNGINDLIICGAYGEMLHFNGMHWKSYREQTAITLGTYQAVVVKGGYIVSVGFEYPRAIVIRGKRIRD